MKVAGRCIIIVNQLRSPRKARRTVYLLDLRQGFLLSFEAEATKEL